MADRQVVGSDDEDGYNSDGARPLGPVCETVLEGVDDAVVVFDVQYPRDEDTEGEASPTISLAHTNEVYASITGIGSDARGETPTGLYGDRRGSRLEATLRACLERREPVEYEPGLEGGEETLPWPTTIRPVVGDDRITALVGIASDVRDRERLERTLAEERAAFEQGPAVVFRWREEPGWPVEFVSDNVASVFGYDPESFRSGERSFADVIHEDDRDRVWAEVEANSDPDTDRFRHEPYRVVTADGEVKWVLDFTTNRRVDGEISHRLGYLVDVTERHRRTRALEETERRLSLALEAADAGVWEWNLETDRVVWDESMEELLGLEPGSFEGTDEAFVERIHPDDRDLTEEVVCEALETADGFEHEFRLQRDDDESLWVLARATVHTDDAGEPTRVVGVGIDVTDRRAVERRLEAERSFFAEAIESLPYPFYVLDVEDYTVEWMNSRADVDPGDACYEVTHRRDRPCDEGDDAVPCPIADVTATGEPAAVEHVHYDEDGDRRHYRVHAAPMTDEDGTVTKIAESNIDITERVASERRLESQRDNLKLLNEVVRHDIRNDLQLIQAYADALEDHVDEAGSDRLEVVDESVQNAVELTKTARDLAEVMLQTDVDGTCVRVDRALEGQLEEIRSAHPEASVVVEGPLPETSVVGDQMLDAVFRNLLSNAIQHNDAPVPEVRVAVSADEHSAADDPDTVTIEVADNGPGVPDDQKAAIFGRGEKGLESAGTGLGLYLVQTLIDRYDGEVRVEDNEPRGAVFVVELPVADPATVR
ncbi:sensor histidine kinase [Natrarchaeobaculum aegyptiacum]|uniref:histidine kinase n=1 Tax=Natrarchaeobaculum aegyptiacum TaxID=745377 RepID=A0A2Z2HPB6_9EURY|nr:PAS domain-containing sensor histidine kinase [Natrarchaeobaculum aegyptiacum]ARS88850.1 hypothetical protein B1756_03155 [Natrarchaeobaculum aegyptiacum]